MPNFTPGPYRKGHPSGTVVSDTLAKDGLNGSDVVAYYGGNLIAESVAPSNIPLLVAAPDLYAALEQLVDWMGLRDNSGELVPIDKQPEQIAAAMRALAKAEGKDG